MPVYQSAGRFRDVTPERTPGGSELGPTTQTGVPHYRLYRRPGRHRQDSRPPRCAVSLVLRVDTPTVPGTAATGAVRPRETNPNRSFIWQCAEPHDHGFDRAQFKCCADGDPGALMQQRDLSVTQRSRPISAHRQLTRTACHAQPRPADSALSFLDSRALATRYGGRVHRAHEVRPARKAIHHSARLIRKTGQEAKHARLHKQRQPNSTASQQHCTPFYTWQVLASYDHGHRCLGDDSPSPRLKGSGRPCKKSITVLRQRRRCVSCGRSRMADSV